MWDMDVCNHKKPNGRINIRNLAWNELDATPQVEGIRESYTSTNKVGKVVIFKGLIHESRRILSSCGIIL